MAASSIGCRGAEGRGYRSLYFFFFVVCFCFGFTG
jgi:hypothetical protein